MAAPSGSAFAIVCFFMRILCYNIGGTRIRAAPSIVSLPSYARISESDICSKFCVNFSRLVADIIGGTRLRAAPSIISLPP